MSTGIEQKLKELQAEYNQPLKLTITAPDIEFPNGLVGYDQFESGETWIYVKRMNEMDMEIVGQEQDIWSGTKILTKFIHLYDGSDLVVENRNQRVTLKIIKLEPIID